MNSAPIKLIMKNNVVQVQGLFPGGNSHCAHRGIGGDAVTARIAIGE